MIRSKRMIGLVKLISAMRRLKPRLDEQLPALLKKAGK